MNRDITFVEVYRINGRLVVAHSLEGAIVTWRERMAGCGTDITKIEKMENNDPTEPPALENRAMMFTDICGEDGLHRQSQEEIAMLKWENDELTAKLEKSERARQDNKEIAEIVCKWTDEDESIINELIGYVTTGEPLEYRRRDTYIKWLVDIRDSHTPPMKKED